MKDVKFDDVVNNDNTLRFFLREAKHYNRCKLMEQVDIKIAAFKIALGRFLDLKYPTKNE